MSEATNAIDPTTAQRFIGEIESCLEELLSERGSYMAKCKTIRERIKDWKERAGDAGISRKALNTELKRRDLQGKIDGLTEDWEEEDVEQLELLQTALGVFGDTDLGKAAIAKAEAAKGSRKGRGRRAAPKGQESDAPKAPGGGDALDGLVSDDVPDDERPRFLREQEAARVAENTERLRGGIKPLN